MGRAESWNRKTTSFEPKGPLPSELGKNWFILAKSSSTEKEAVLKTLRSLAVLFLLSVALFPQGSVALRSLQNGLQQLPPEIRNCRVWDGNSVYFIDNYGLLRPVTVQRAAPAHARAIRGVCCTRDARQEPRGT